MPRPPRGEEPGATFHVVARGTNKRDIYLDDADRRGYLQLIGRVVDRTEWRCLAYCLMGNHLHLLIHTPQPNLGYGMQRLHGDYARAFNDRHGCSGHLFHKPYWSKRLDTERYLWTATAYVAQNPVAAGMCAEPEDWRWSSHGAISAGRPPEWLAHGRLLEMLSAFGDDPELRYADCVRWRLADQGPPTAR